LTVPTSSVAGVSTTVGASRAAPDDQRIGAFAPSGPPDADRASPSTFPSNRPKSPPLPIETASGGHVVVVDLARSLHVLPSDRLRGRLRAHVSGPDRPEDIRRIRHCRSTHGDRQRRRGRIAARRDRAVEERAHCRRQHGLERRQRPMALHREIPARRRRTPREGTHDVGSEASGSEQGRLHGDAEQLVARVGIDGREDGRAVGPRAFARCERRHLHRSARDRRCDQREPPEAG
jgi:hypothetical protein